MKLIIRDDDANFFTHPEDIEKAYSEILDFPVSFAVVPMVVDVIGGCPETKGNLTPRFVGDNVEISRYLKDRFHNGSCDILLHGIYHQYKFPNGVKTPEMIWRETETQNLDVEIGLYKTKLENLFDIDINCFVAPSNRIMKKGIQAVYKNGMHYSGIIPISFDRDLTFKSIKNYFFRWTQRAMTGLAYPGILDYGTHLELNACNQTNFPYLKKMFEYCQRHDTPMAINVHYWHIRDNKEHYRGFFDFVKYALDNGAEPVRMRDCLPMK
ncbi:MAG: DUF2334 domain-containing protein [Bacteroidia bacterium]|nr:DUF2334 domain-containing protein [Bacteroidia bacterium]